VLVRAAGWTHRRIPSLVLALACGTLAGAVSAAAEEPAAGARGPAAPASHRRYIPARGAVHDTSASDLIYEGGPVIPSAKVVFIFWGPSFGNASSPDHLYAQQLQAFRNQFGTTPEFNVITQYYQTPGPQHIRLTHLDSGTPDWFDGSTPPTNVTDAVVQGEVSAYLGSHAFDASTIYEVVIPSSSYSSMDDGTTSCGGPNLTYCAYHTYFQTGSDTVKYSIEPYPSCGGCQVPGWTPAENQEHFVTHETRESVTDQQIDAWLDGNGEEADDKCAWSPSPFIGSGGYGYQYEWSNATSSCVQSIPISSPAGRFFTVTPCRLLDTRSSSPLLEGDTYEVAIAGNCGIAAAAVAVSANVTVVNAKAGGFLSLWPAQAADPGTSTINFRAGQVRANNTVLALAPGTITGSPGAVWAIFGGSAGSSVDVIIDVNGYFE